MAIVGVAKRGRDVTVLEGSGVNECQGYARYR